VNLLLLWLSPLGTVVTRLQAELPTEKDECIELKKHLEDLGDHVHGESRNEGGREGWGEWTRFVCYSEGSADVLTILFFFPLCI